MVAADQVVMDRYADDVGGAARFLAKDGAGGGEARFSGLWRSIDSGASDPSAAFALWPCRFYVLC